MTKLDIYRAFSKLKVFTQKHLPELFAGIGIGTGISAVFFAVKGTVNAIPLIDIRKKELNKNSLTKAEVVKTVWKCYLPALIFEGLSIGFTIGSVAISTKRNAALATAYAIAESSLQDYKIKVAEIAGSEKSEEISNKIAEEKYNNAPKDESRIIDTGEGKTLCYDSLTDRYFRSNPMKIREQVLNLNTKMINETYISLNEFYDAINLPKINPAFGDALGWNIEKGIIVIDLVLKELDNGDQFVYIDYGRVPTNNYSTCI